MYKVICFYWQGDRWQETEGAGIREDMDPSFRRHLLRVGKAEKSLVERYVNNLFKGVTRHSEGKEFQFICFTNEMLDVDKSIRLQTFPMVSKKGVIPRMYMFSEEAGLFGSQVLCLDLDVVITGSLKDIMSYEGLFCTRRGFAGPDKGKLDGDIMSFKAGPETEDVFWKPFIKNVKNAERVTQGRERFWVRRVAGEIAEAFDEVTPNQILSYKSNVRRRGLPSNARIVSCHGHPRPHQINEPWIKKHWK